MLAFVLGVVAVAAVALTKVLVSVQALGVLLGQHSVRLVVQWEAALVPPSVLTQATQQVPLSNIISTMVTAI